MIPWHHITLFGDVSITSLAALAILIWLLAEKEHRLAFWWALLFAGGTALVVASKIAYIGWGIGIHALDFSGFSGHAMRITAVAPVLMYLLLQKTSPAMRALGVFCGFLFAALVGVSRLAVHAHSVSEVVSGWILGGVISVAFIGVASSLQKYIFNPKRIALVVLALLPAPYVQPAPTQEWLTTVSLYISGHDKPYHRVSWKPCPPQAKPPIES
jgi:membrane-associated phospholipid phosphatase